MGFFNWIKSGLSRKPGKDFEHEKPENWKWGVFYYNPRDYRFIVPKRNPIMGWTFNFAHPVSYVVFLLIILIPILYHILLK